ncbi:hypothetical protein [Mesobacillus zeae]|uniref:hypothetical protein n=1 Tax=Mesobacillus zeae TaxID=1917180 RepID=UPI0030082762
MIRPFQKKKPDFEELEDIEIENKAKKEIKIDYMKYFFDESNRNCELHQSICKKLDTYSLKELNKLATEVLSDSLGFLRYSSEVKEPYRNPSFINFHFAVIWHLSDSIHNIPTSLDDHFKLTRYLSGFFVFIYILKNLENKPLARFHERYYLDLNITKWEHFFL